MDTMNAELDRLYPTDFFAAAVEDCMAEAGVTVLYVGLFSEIQRRCDELNTRHPSDMVEAMPSRRQVRFANGSRLVFSDGTSTQINKLASWHFSSIYIDVPVSKSVHDFLASRLRGPGRRTIYARRVDYGDHVVTGLKNGEGMTIDLPLPDHPYLAHFRWIAR